MAQNARLGRPLGGLLLGVWGARLGGSACVAPGFGEPARDRSQERARIPGGHPAQARREGYAWPAASHDHSDGGRPTSADSLSCPRIEPSAGECLRTGPSSIKPSRSGRARSEPGVASRQDRSQACSSWPTPAGPRLRPAVGARGSDQSGRDRWPLRFRTLDRWTSERPVDKSRVGSSLWSAGGQESGRSPLRRSDPRTKSDPNRIHRCRSSRIRP